MLKYISNIIIIILLPLNVIFDVLTNVVFSSGGAFSYVRALLLLVILAYVIVTNKQEKSLFIPFLLFIIYCSIQIPFSSDLVYSLSMTLKILIPLLTFFVGFSLVTSDNKLRLLNSSVLIVQLVLCLNFFISNYLGIGNDVYSKENPFLAGNLNDNWNIISYSLIVTPLIFKYNKRKKITLIISLFSFGLLLLSMKRIAILVVILGLIYYLLKTKLKTALNWSFGFLLLILVASPIMWNKLETRIESRQDKFSGSQIDVMKEENRFLETIAVWTEVIQFKKPTKAIFGGEAFNSIGNYGGGVFKNRQLHVDYNLIVNTIGVVGLLLYLNIFFSIYLYTKNKKLFLNKKIFYTIYMVFIALFYLQFITSLGGQMYQVTFRSIIFIYLGALIRLIKNKNNLIYNEYSLGS